MTKQTYIPAAREIGAGEIGSGDIDTGEIAEKMNRAIDAVFAEQFSADQCDAVAKAGYVVVKAAEVDLKRRIQP